MNNFDRKAGYLSNHASTGGLKMVRIISISGVVCLLIAGLILLVLPFGTRGENPDASVVLKSEELASSLDIDIGDYFLTFEHRWGNASRVRDFHMFGSGEFLLRDCQDAEGIKEAIISGYRKASDFTPNEYAMIMRDNISYNHYSRGKFDEGVVRDLIAMVANRLNNDYEQSPTSGDSLTEKILLYIVKGQKALSIVEEVNEAYHNLDKLRLVIDIETLLENALKDTETVEITPHEYTIYMEPFFSKAEIGHRAFDAQWKLRKTSLK